MMSAYPVIVALPDKAWKWGYIDKLYGFIQDLGSRCIIRIVVHMWILRRKKKRDKPSSEELALELPIEYISGPTVSESFLRLLNASCKSWISKSCESLLISFRGDKTFFKSIWSNPSIWLWIFSFRLQLAQSSVLLRNWASHIGKRNEALLDCRQNVNY